MNIKRSLAAAIIIFLITGNIPVYADHLSDQLQRQQQLFQQNRNTYDDIDNQIEQSEANIEKLDEQINDILYQMDEIKLKIGQAKQAISDMEVSIQKSVDDLKAEEESFGKRVKAMYTSGTLGYLDILLESQSFGDFISRMDIVSRIIQYDKGMINDLRVKNQEITDKKQALVSQKDKLASLQQENEKKLAELNSAKSAQAKIASDLRNQQKLYASRMKEYQAQINETLKQIQAMKDAAKKTSRNGSKTVLASRGGDISGNDVVAYAANFLGVPYIWGGNTPAGFDCSGFTKYVFAHFGINLYRRASEQAFQGVPVSIENLQPGDLVFFGNPIYHVGIYVGNGCFIHAPSTGDVVKVTPLRWMSFSGARRVR